MNPKLHVQILGAQDYEVVWQAMRQRNACPEQDWPGDEIWLVEHRPVYTLGSSGKAHFYRSHHIPLIPVDRGGNITYHGPGQLVIYPLLTLRSYALPPTELVNRLEQIFLNWMQAHHIPAHRHADQRGLFIEDKKILSLGLRIAHGRTYHGLAINLDMDLEPFTWIDPCGQQNLEMTQWIEHAPLPKMALRDLALGFCDALGYQRFTSTTQGSWERIPFDNAL